MKRNMIVLAILLTFLLSISAASATEGIASDIVSADTTNDDLILEEIDQETNLDNANQESELEETSQETILEDTFQDDVSTNANTADISANTNTADVSSNTNSEEDGSLSEENTNLSFSQLSAAINSAGNILELNSDYVFNPETDGNYVNGIAIKKNNFVINGNNHIIDAKNSARIFTMLGMNVTLNNIIFKNAKSPALNITQSELSTNNVTFINCTGANKQGEPFFLMNQDIKVAMTNSLKTMQNMVQQYFQLVHS